MGTYSSSKDKKLAMSTRSKGNRTKNRIKEYYQSLGYIVADGEQVSKYSKVQDLFSDYCLNCKEQCRDHKGEGLICKCGDKDSEQDRFPGFDLVAINDKHTVWIQCKTNSPSTQRPMKEFAKAFVHRKRYIVCATWYDRAGLRIQKYCKNGSIIEKDLR